MPASPKKSRKWAGNAVARGAGKVPRSGPKRARSAEENAANCTYSVRRFGGQLLTSTGLAAAMDREARRLCKAAGKLLNKQKELKVTAANQGCSVEALADGDLTKLEDQYALKLFGVRQLEWNMREGNFKPVDPCEMLRNSKRSHMNKRQKPEAAPVMEAGSAQGHPVWANSIQGLGAGVAALPAPPRKSGLF